ncbi:MAG TPA: sulfotransferase [Gammaproteobacteria bacterium]
MRRYLFIIGAQRSGTTLLAQGLDLHPDLDFAKPIRPEPKYLLRPDAEISVEDYEDRYFKGLPADVMRAEKSTSYIEYPEVARRIARLFPGARCIAVLRDPVERAVSNYWFSVQHGFEKRPPEEALDPAAESDAKVAGLSASPFAYLKRGRYLEFLDSYAGIVGADKLLVLQTERLVKDAAAWADVHQFLKLEQDPPPDSQERANAVPRERPIAEATLRALTEYFAPYNAELARRYRLDLALWRRPG